MSLDAIAPLNMQKSGADCPKQGVQAKRVVCRKTVARRKMTARRDVTMSWLGCYLATIFSALLGAFFLGVIAVGASDYNAVFGGGPLAPLANAYGYLAIIFGVIVTFSQFYAGHLAPHVTLAAWLDDPARFTLFGILRYVSIFAFELLGFYLAALYTSFVVGGVPATLGCAEPAAGVGIAAQFLTSLFVKLLVGHTFLLSAKRYKWGPFGGLAIALEVSAAILALGPVTGGSYSLWRYLGIAFVQGGACLTASTALIEFGTFVVAGVVNYLLATFLFTRACSTMGACDKKAKVHKAKDC